jgi:hypothetical protein
MFGNNRLGQFRDPIGISRSAHAATITVSRRA